MITNITCPYRSLFTILDWTIGLDFFLIEELQIATWRLNGCQQPIIGLLRMLYVNITNIHKISSFIYSHNMHKLVYVDLNFQHFNMPCSQLYYSRFLLQQKLSNSALRLPYISCPIANVLRLNGYRIQLQNGKIEEGWFIIT